MQENIIKKGAANWVDGWNAKGGKLIQTDQSIYFEGHAFNIGKKQNELKLKEIQEVTTKFLNFLIITTKDGRKIEYRVNGRKKWQQAIQKQILFGDDHEEI